MSSNGRNDMLFNQSIMDTSLIDRDSTIVITNNSKQKKGKNMINETSSNSLF
jgi:hypothetical protein